MDDNDTPKGLANPEVKAAAPVKQAAEPLPVHEAREPRWQQIGSVTVVALFVLYLVYVIFFANR